MNFWQAGVQGIDWVTETVLEEAGGTKPGCRGAEGNWRDKRTGTFWGRVREEEIRSETVKTKREQCQEGWTLKLLHDGRSLYLEGTSLGLVLSASIFHTVLIMACFLFQTATGVLIWLRQRN